MEKLNCFRGQFDFQPGQFVYQQPPTEGPKEQGEKREAPKKNPDEARRDGQRAEVKARYGDDNLEKVTPEKAKEVLSDPAKLQQFLADFEKSRMEGGMEKQERFMKPEHIVREMLDAVKTDTAFLKKVIETYADKVDSQYGYVCNNAIERIDLVDDEFFKGVFEKSTDYHIRSEALRKIQDESYKLSKILDGLSELGKQTKVVEKNPGEFHYFESQNYTVARDAITSLTKPESLQRVISAIKGDDAEAKYARELAQKRLEELQAK